MKNKTEAELRVEKAAAELAEEAVQGKPPFDKCVGHLLSNRYATYFAEYDQKAQRDLIAAYVASAQFSVAGEAYRNDEAFRKIREFEAPLAEQLRRNAVPVRAEQGLALRRYAREARRKLVETRMAGRFPDYRLDSELVPLAIPQAVIFSKQLLRNTKTFIAFDLGTGKTDGILHSYIGLDRPFYSARPASFFGSIIRGVYYNSEELGRLLQETNDLLEVLLPPFTQKMRETLGDVGLSAVPNGTS
jgi:hypothetical protein